MTATGSMIDEAMAAVETINAVAVPSAKTAYQLMVEILGNNAQPLIFASLPLSAAAIGEGLAAYQATLVDSRLAYAKVGLDVPEI